MSRVAYANDDEAWRLGSNIFDKYASALTIVLLHMLKWDHQPLRRSRSWVRSIVIHRLRMTDALASSPSFKSRQVEAVLRAYRVARSEAAKETDLQLKTFPETCPYNWTAITTREHQLPGDDA